MKALVLFLGIFILLVSTRIIATPLGETIYKNGQGRDGRPINATLPGGINLQGEAVACQGCHGKDGMGGGESFVKSPNIRWSNLNNHFQQRDVSKNQKYYDKKLFTRALNQGIKAGGQAIDPIMPRFDLATDEIEALIAFLSDNEDPKNHVPVALTLLPEEGISKFADSLAVNIQSCELNVPGTHTWPLEIIRFKSIDEAIDKLQKRLASGSVKFIVAPFIVGWEHDYLEVMSKFQSPILLPYTPLDLPENKNVYLAFPGLQKQLKALVDEAKNQNIKKLITVSSDEDSLADSLYEQIADYAKGKNIDLQRISVNETYKLEKTTDAILIFSPVPTVMEKIKNLKTFKDTKKVFVPAIYFQPPSENSFKWLIAYPYPPNNSIVKQGWEFPINKWSVTVCSILALTANDPDSSWWKNNLRSKTTKTETPQKSDLGIMDNALVLPWK